jgi:hypothetical protein
MNTTAEKLEKIEKLDVGDNVIKKLGTPPNFLKAKAIPVFGNFHRVNIYINIDANNDGIIKRSSIAYSYLVEADKAGNILDSKPEIVKLFE